MRLLFFFFFFNDTATTEIYTLSLHDALPISVAVAGRGHRSRRSQARAPRWTQPEPRLEDRKSTRLNSSHSQISYAVFCLKKKKPTAARLRDLRTAPMHVPVRRHHPLQRALRA